MSKTKQILILSLVFLFSSCVFLLLLSLLLETTQVPNLFTSLNIGGQNKTKKGKVHLSFHVRKWCILFACVLFWRLEKEMMPKKRKERHAQSSTKGSKKKAENTCLPQKKLSFWQANFLFWQQQKKKLFWSSVKKKFSVH